jgi:hypothetical protein
VKSDRDCMSRDEANPDPRGQELGITTANHSLVGLSAWRSLLWR